MLKFEDTLNLTDEDANHLLELVKLMGQTPEVENTLDKTKKYFIKIEELK